MRKSSKEIRDEAVLVNLMNTCHVGRLGTIGRDGYPMVKPLNFAYIEGKIYFHSAREGEKIEDIGRDPRVCFETDLPIAYVKGIQSPCRSEYLYRSVIIKGKAAVVEDGEERINALRCLMQKYQPEGGYADFPPEKLAITAIVRINIEEITGKEDLGKGVCRDAVLKALADEVTLPIRIEN